MKPKREGKDTANLAAPGVFVGAPLATLRAALHFLYP